MLVVDKPIVIDDDVRRKLKLLDTSETAELLKLAPATRQQ